MAARKTDKVNAEAEVSLQSEQAVKADPKFSKQQLVECGRYKNRKDLVDALLADNEEYTMKQVDEMIEKFMKRTVK